MITKYTEFINENWQVEFNQSVKEIIKSVVTKNDIEDVFLELTDIGFNIIVDYKSGYFDGWLIGIGKKSDLVLHDCYPFVKVELISQHDREESNFDNTQRKLKDISNYINKIKIACDRLLHQRSNMQLVKDHVNIGTAVKFTLLFRINNKLVPYSSDDVEKYSPIHKIVNNISNNKLFTLGVVTDNEVYFTCKDRPGIREIVLSIFDKLIRSGRIRVLEVGELEYKIEIL